MGKKLIIVVVVIIIIIFLLDLISYLLFVKNRDQANNDRNECILNTIRFEKRRTPLEAIIRSRISPLLIEIDKCVERKQKERLAATVLKTTGATSMTTANATDNPNEERTVIEPTNTTDTSLLDRPPQPVVQMVKKNDF